MPVEIVDVNDSTKRLSRAVTVVGVTAMNSVFVSTDLTQLFHLAIVCSFNVYYFICFFHLKYEFVDASKHVVAYEC